MGEFNIAVDSFPIWKAIVWCFYPISCLVVLELCLRLLNDDDDDDFDGEKLFHYTLLQHLRYHATSIIHNNHSILLST